MHEAQPIGSPVVEAPPVSQANFGEAESIELGQFGGLACLANVIPQFTEGHTEQRRSLADRLRLQLPHDFVPQCRVYVSQRAGGGLFEIDNRDAAGVGQKSFSKISYADQKLWHVGRCKKDS